MSTQFSPQLIGETEKTLNALLGRFLEESELTEPQWVTLRLADRLDGSVDADGLAATVADRAHFPDAAEIIRGLNDRGLLEEGRLTSAGRQVVVDVQATITTETAPIWENLDDGDVAATTRVLNEVLAQARRILKDT